MMELLKVILFYYVGFHGSSFCVDVLCCEI